jgi:hypothetical protein
MFVPCIDKLGMIPSDKNLDRIPECGRLTEDASLEADGADAVIFQGIKAVGQRGTFSDVDITHAAPAVCSAPPGRNHCLSLSPSHRRRRYRHWPRAMMCGAT